MTVFIPFLIACAALAAQAQDFSSATLSAVVELARARNPDIVVARKMWEAQQAKVGVESALPAPEIGVEYMGFSRSSFNPSASEEKRYDVSQGVPFPGKLRLRGKAAAHKARREEDLYRAAERDVVAAVKEAYFELLLAQRTLKVYEETSDLLKRIAGIAQSKYAVGKASQPSVLRAQVELSKAQNGSITSRLELGAAIAKLNALLARPPDAPLEALEEPQAGPLPDLSRLERTALAHRPELHAAHHHVDHMRAEVAAARSDYLPDFMFQYTWRTRTGMPPDSMAAASMTLPFLWFRRQRALVRSTLAEKHHADAVLSAARLKTLSELRETSAALDSAHRTVELYRTTILPQAEQSLSVAESGYRSDRVGFLDLLDSERALVESKLDYYKAVSALGGKQAQLERIVGVELKALPGGIEP